MTDIDALIEDLEANGAAHSEDGSDCLPCGAADALREQQDEIGRLTKVNGTLNAKQITCLATHSWPEVDAKDIHLPTELDN